MSFSHWGDLYERKTIYEKATKMDAKSCGKAIEAFMVKAREAEKKLDWSKITHLSVIVFGQINKRFMAPVSKLTPEDKAIASVRGTVSTVYHNMDEQIIGRWLDCRMQQWPVQSGDARLIIGGVLEIVYHMD